MSGADKLGYLIRALSRTKRKDYENYVVNAIRGYGIVTASAR